MGAAWPREEEDGHDGMEEVTDAVISILSKHLGINPSAAPFETAFQDAVGFAVFFWLASLLVNYLH